MTDTDQPFAQGVPVRGPQNWANPDGKVTPAVGYLHVVAGAGGVIHLATLDAGRADEFARNTGSVVGRLPVVADYREGADR